MAIAQFGMIYTCSFDGQTKYFRDGELMNPCSCCGKGEWEPRIRAGSDTFTALLNGVDDAIYHMQIADILKEGEVIIVIFPNESAKNGKYTVKKFGDSTSMPDVDAVVTVELVDRELDRSKLFHCAFYGMPSHSTIY